MPYDLPVANLIIVLCCKLHNLNIRTGEERDGDHKYRFPSHEMNNVEGDDQDHLKNNLHMVDGEPFVKRSGSNEDLRAYLAE